MTKPAITQETTWLQDDAKGEPTVWRTESDPSKARAVIRRCDNPEAFDLIAELWHQRFDSLFPGCVDSDQAARARRKASQ